MTDGRCSRRRGIDGSATEHGVSQRVVGVVAVGSAVKPLTIEEFGDVDEHQRDAVREAPLVIRHGLQAITHPQAGLQALGAVNGDAAIARQDERDGVPQRSERVGQRRRHSASPPVLAKGWASGVTISTDRASAPQ